MKAQLFAAVILAFMACLVATNAPAGTCTCADSTLAIAGGYSVFAASPWQPSQQFVITCNGNATYDVTISTGSSGNYSNRVLRQGGAGAALNYNIYTDATHSTVWGGTTRRTYDTSSGKTNFADPLYFDFTAGQDVPFSGLAYLDTVSVTLDPAPGTGGASRSCTTTLQAMVNAECLAPAATLPFGNYDPANVNATTALDKTASLLYRCTQGVNATVSLDLGGHATGTTRYMAGPPGNLLRYELYTDSARTTVWDSVNTMGGMSSGIGPNNYIGGLGGLTVFGRIPPGQSVIAGAYSDSVTATINY